MKSTNDVTTSCHDYWFNDVLPSMIEEVEEQIEKGTEQEIPVLRDYLKHLNDLKSISESLSSRPYTFQEDEVKAS